MLRTLIIDDELHAREAIKEMLLQNCPYVSVVAEAESVVSGIAKIQSYDPELVFLDIKLTDGTGFDILKAIESYTFKVIFITAFEEFAIKAFKFSALDYLLKPIDPDELKLAVRKAEDSVEEDIMRIKLRAFFNNYDGENWNGIKKLVLKTTNNVHIVNVKDILRCESDKNYTHFYLVNGIEIIVSKTLKEYSDILADFEFFRTHQSHLINLNYIDRFEKADGGSLIMKDESRVPVSFRKKDELMRYFKML